MYGCMRLDSYSLQDLASLTHLEPRTIRSYIERGLIPGPDTRGRNASYTADHLHRLQVLNLLRDAYRHLTLEQARQLLQRLSAQQIHDLATGRLRIGALIEVDEDRPRSSALEYLTALRERTSADAEAPAGQVADAGGASQSAASAGAVTAVEHLLAALMKLAADPNPPRSARADGWIRITITPDIELSIRDSLPPDHIGQLRRVADLLRVVLTKGVRT